MKSRWTTCLLLVAVTAVWSVVAWKIFAPPAVELPAEPPKRGAPAAAPVVETLRLDYPDPFLKGVPRVAATARSTFRPLPTAKYSPPRRERVEIAHLGTVSSAGRQLHILTIGGEQYELSLGETASGFVLAAVDGDSLYLRKAGVNYGVKRCLP